jgi:hypothetical protein
MLNTTGAKILPSTVQEIINATEKRRAVREIAPHEVRVVGIPMYIAKTTLDDLLRQVFEKVVKHGVTVNRYYSSFRFTVLSACRRARR